MIQSNAADQSDIHFQMYSCLSLLIAVATISILLLSGLILEVELKESIQGVYLDDGIWLTFVSHYWIDESIHYPVPTFPFYTYLFWSSILSIKFKNCLLPAVFFLYECFHI
jgi:hypothetical protein